MIMEEKPSKLVPALIGGGTMGLLSTIPIINMGNCFCCMWILLGGAVGAYFYWRELPPGSDFNSGDGALVGLLSGIFGALFGTVLGYFFIAFWSFNPAREILESFLESSEDVPPEFEDFLEALQEGGTSSAFFAFIGLFFSLVIDSIFGTLGGIIGTALLKKRKRPSETKSKK
jgi:hypothetical protein